MLKNAFDISLLKNITHAYRLIKTTRIDELKLTVVELIHEKSQAKHIHLARNDPNMTFAIQFRTTPRDSTGVAHVLEHTALCGSQLYPVRDPFFKMLTRSLSTFMNAFTASDWTMYPFSTMNHTDYSNLLNIYMDASLRPLLRKHEFLQEGWRLEPSKLDDPSSSLQLKGVVYNEMKGIFTTGTNIFAETAHRSLMPQNYGVVSGGHPEDIPSLTWEQLKNFHTHYYHPSNSRIYTYGNIDLAAVLHDIDRDFLSHFTALEQDTSLRPEPVWTSSRRIEMTCPPDPMASDPERQNVVAMSYMLNDIQNYYENFKLSILCRLLVDGESSPFYKHLLESGLGQDWAGHMHGFQGETRNSCFSIGLQGVHSDNIDQVEPLVEQIFQTVAKEGIEKSRLEATLHQIELGLKRDSAHYGLHLILSIAYPLNHDVSPDEVLQINQLISRFRADMLSNPNLLCDMVQHYFLNNKHKLTSVMRPDENHIANLKAKEDSILASKVAALTDVDREDVFRASRELADLQSKKEDLSCLPCLHENDLSPQSRIYEFSTEMIQGVPCQINDAPTNGLVYLNMLLNANDLPQELLPYFPLFCNLFTQVGAGEIGYSEFSHRADLVSGGLDSGFHLLRSPTTAGNGSLSSVNLRLGSHALLRNLPAMLDLWQRLLQDPASVNFQDRQRVWHLVQQEVASNWSAHVISSSGHSFARGRASAVLDTVGRLAQLWSGLEQGQFMKQLAQELQPAQRRPEDSGLAWDEKRMERLVESLMSIARHLLSRNRLRIAINGDSESLSLAMKSLNDFISSIPLNSKDVSPQQVKSDTLIRSVESLHSLPALSYYVFPLSVNYCATSYLIPSYADPTFARYRVLAKILTTRYLHTHIREKGGAYGGGVSATPNRFEFYSYRDPNSSSTMQTFDQSLQWIEDSFDELDDQQLLEAKLSIFQELDAPIPAGSRGLNYFLSGLDNKLRQLHRDSVFKVDLDSVRSTAHILLSMLKEGGMLGRTIIGSEIVDVESKEGKYFKNWERIKLD